MPLDALATMITLFTRGCQPSEEDLRWIDEQMILPASPPGTSTTGTDRPGFRLPSDQLRRIGRVFAERLSQEQGLEIWAMTLQPWYAHLVIAGSLAEGSALITAANAVTGELLEGPGNYWSGQCIVRYCFDTESVRGWMAYVQWHNEAMGWSAQPWPHITPPNFLPDKA